MIGLGKHRGILVSATVQTCWWPLFRRVSGGVSVVCESASRTCSSFYSNAGETVESASTVSDDTRRAWREASARSKAGNRESVKRNSGWRRCLGHNHWRPWLISRKPWCSHPIRPQAGIHLLTWKRLTGPRPGYRAGCVLISAAREVRISS